MCQSGPQCSLLYQSESAYQSGPGYLSAHQLGQPYRSAPAYPSASAYRLVHPLGPSYRSGLQYQWGLAPLPSPFGQWPAQPSLSRPNLA